jgi:excisionase family DNA binding protein
METISHSVERAAELTDIPQTKLRQAISDGLLRSFKVGRSLRVSDKALREFISKLEYREIVISRQQYKDRVA